MRRGQAATEFLMTYGWALAGILLVFGALYYYFSPSAPNTCRVDQPFTCVDLKADSANNDISLVLSSSGVDDTPIGPTISALTIIGQTFTCNKEIGPPSADNKLKDANDYQQVINFDCDPRDLKKGESFNGEFSITYTKSGGLPHTASGSFYINVE